MIRHIIMSTPPARLFELYYWAQEPRLLKLFRRLATLSPANRQAIESFFELADDSSIRATWGPGGALVLEAKHLPEDVAAIAYLLEDEDNNPPDKKTH